MVKESSAALQAFIPRSTPLFKRAYPFNLGSGVINTAACYAGLLGGGYSCCPHTEAFFGDRGSRPRTDQADSSHMVFQTSERKRIGSPEWSQASRAPGRCIDAVSKSRIRIRRSDTAGQEAALKSAHAKTFELIEYAVNQNVLVSSP